MFVLKKSHTYFWPVKTETPKDGGQFDKAVFDVEFRQLSQTRIKKVFGKNISGETQPNDSEFCKEIIVGWKGVKDEDGNDIEFSDTNLDQILEIPSMPQRIVDSYLDSIAGSRAKN